MFLKLSIILLSIYFNLAQAEGSPQETFPALQGETLTGHDVSLPEAFQNQSAWMIIGFTKDSQKETSLCAEKLNRVFQNQGYSVAMIQGAPFFIKGIIKDGIRSTVPESRREKFFILNEGRESLQDLAGFEEKSKDQAYVLGIRSKSVKEYVLGFKNHGSCNDEGYLSSVKKSIQELAH